MDIISEPNMHDVGMWEVVGAPGESPRKGIAEIQSQNLTIVRQIF